MPRKTDQSFGALLVTTKRLPCDFTAMRDAQPQPVKICYLALRSYSSSRENSLTKRRNFSRAVRGKAPIRSNCVEKMRGAFGDIEGWRQDNQMRRYLRISSRALRSHSHLAASGDRYISVSAGSSRDFFLFYLTGRTIFDNRHGLLNKLHRGRRAKPCQP
jgi:hypothetical protein